MTYDDFRSGLTFADVREILKSEQNQAYQRGQYMWVSRGTVLGRWRQYKLEMWEAYQRTRRMIEDEGLPF